MLLTQNPAQINFSHHHHHRRHTASIAVVPTGTPGLLTLSKPTARLPSRRPQSPRFPPRSRIHRPSTADPSDQPRGRPTIPKHPAQQVQRRSPSQVQLPDTPPPVQPVPPQLLPSTPEPPTLAAHPSGRLARTRRTRHKSTPTATLLAPDASPERTKTTRAPSPGKVSQPSAPIAVPERHRAASPTPKVFSRSDPLSKLTIHTNLAAPTKRKDKRRRNRNKRNGDGALPLAEWDFPAPGSSDEAEGEDEEDDEPVTPVAQTGPNDKAWQRALNEGPRTAPLQSAQGQFPFFQFPMRPVPPRTKTPAPGPAPVFQTTPRKQDHRRAPSQSATLSRANTFPEGIFHLSEDETDTLPKDADVREKMALLFGNGRGASNGPTPLFPVSPSPRKVQRAVKDRESAQIDGAARQLFASSSFQLAPEPVELPKPSFLLSVRA